MTIGLASLGEPLISTVAIENLFLGDLDRAGLPILIAIWPV